MADANSTVRLLLIDDDEDSWTIFRGLLSQNRRQIQFVLEYAATFEAGLEAIRHQQFDALLVDYHLGARDGLELLRLAMSDGHRGPFIFVTGNDDPNLELEILSAGAADLLLKDEVNSRTLTRSVMFAIEQARSRSKSEQLRRTEDEMNVARAIQQRMQRTAIPTIAGLDIGASCQPAAAAGGDFFDVSLSLPSSVGLTVADVSSHGFGPALIMSDTRRLVRTLSRQGWDIADIFGAVNQALLEDTDDALFVTMFLAMLDCKTNRLLYAGAGHESYVLKPSGEVERLESTSLPLGVSDTEKFHLTRVAQLRPGDMLVMISDGFQEAKSAHGDYFGVGRVLETVHSYRQEPTQQIIEELFRTVFQFCQPGIPNDDMTAVIVKVGIPN